MSKWLRGHYSETDFVSSANADDESVRIKREMSRTAYIDQACQEATASPILEDNYDRQYPHPLSSYRDIQISRVEDEATCAKHSATRQKEQPQLRVSEVADENSDERTTCALLQ